jgi:hypothetical protein
MESGVLQTNAIDTNKNVLKSKIILGIMAF